MAGLIQTEGSAVKDIGFRANNYVKVFFDFKSVVDGVTSPYPFIGVVKVLLYPNEKATTPTVLSAGTGGLILSGSLLSWGFNYGPLYNGYVYEIVEDVAGKLETLFKGKLQAQFDFNKDYNVTQDTVVHIEKRNYTLAVNISKGGGQGGTAFDNVYAKSETYNRTELDERFGALQTELLLDATTKVNTAKAQIQTTTDGIIASLAQKEAIGVAQTLVNSLQTTLLGGIATDKNTFQKLYDNLQNKITGIQLILQSDDVSLDTLQEIIVFIKANQDALSNVTTNKLNVSVYNSFLTQYGNDLAAKLNTSVYNTFLTQYSTDLASKSNTTHNHDSLYSPIGHNHNGVYATSGHNHDGVYSLVGHNHDSTYLKISDYQPSSVNPDSGDGVDGDVTISGGTTTLQRDMYYNNLTVASTGILVTNGHRVFVKGTTTIQAGGNINRNGTNGGNASGTNNGTGGTAGTAQSDAALARGQAGSAGANGATGAGTTGALPGTSGGSMGGSGGGGSAGGNGTSGTGGTSQPANTVTYWPLRTITQNIVRGNAYIYGGTGGRGGSSGSGDGTNVGGAGGGGGNGGAVVAIWTRVLNNLGSIEARGGNGGNGGSPTSGNCGGGGAGSGGGGGFVYIIAKTIQSLGTINVSAGTNGTPGTGSGTGTAGGAVNTQPTGGKFTAYEYDTQKWYTSENPTGA